MKQQICFKKPGLKREKNYTGKKEKKTIVQGHIIRKENTRKTLSDGQMTRLLFSF